MAAVRKRNESSVIDQIGDDLLSWVSTLVRVKFSSFRLFLILNSFHNDRGGMKKKAYQVEGKETAGLK